MAQIVELAELGTRQPPGGRLFGLDLGTKTIGMAVCDGGLRIATPYLTIRRTRHTQDVAEIARLAAREMVFGLVIGLPLNMDGTEGPRAQSTRAFVRNLAGKLDLPVAFQDERLSTVAAEEAMIAAGTKRGRRAANIDAAAAAIILQSALDELARP